MTYSDSHPDSVLRRQRRPEARPDEILDAAFEVFGDQGFARARLDDVARLAGVCKGTLYLYFSSKEELFREMVRARVVINIATGEELLRSHRGSSRELLELMAARMWELLRKPATAKLARLVTSELANFPELARFYFDEVIIPTRRLLERAITRGIESGEFRPVDVPLAARTIALSLVHWAQYQRFFGVYDSVHYTDDQVRIGLLDLLSHTLIAPPGESREG